MKLPSGKPTSKKSGLASVRPLTLTLGVESKSFSASVDDDSKEWFVEGFASTDDVDLTQYSPTAKHKYGLRVSDEALQELVVWAKKLPTVFLNHDLSIDIGKIVDCAIVDGKFWVKVLISKTRPEIWTRIVEGVLCKFSVSFIPLEEKLEDIPGVGKLVRVIKHLVGLETSVVGLPMNPEADITVAYAAGFLKNIEDMLSGETAEVTQMTRKQLVQGIKERLVALNAATEAEQKDTLQIELNDFHQRLALIAPEVPPLAEGWDFAEEIIPSAADEVKPEVVAAPVAEIIAPVPAVEPVVAPVAEVVAAPAPAAETVAPVVEAVADVAAAVAAAVVAPAATVHEASVTDVLQDAVSQMFGSVVKRSIPMEVFANLSWLDNSLDCAEIPDKVKNKTREMVVSMLKMVAETVQIEKQGAAEVNDLGAVKRSFELQLAALAEKQTALAAATDAKVAELQKELAAKAEALGVLEKRHADFMSKTLTPANGVPPPVVAAPARVLTREEQLKAVWLENPLISVGR